MEIVGNVKVITCHTAKSHAPDAFSAKCRGRKMKRKERSRSEHRRNSGGYFRRGSLPGHLHRGIQDQDQSMEQPFWVDRQQNDGQCEGRNEGTEEGAVGNCQKAGRACNTKGDRCRRQYQSRDFQFLQRMPKRAEAL